MDMDDNLRAFLKVIQHAEGTDRSRDPYRVTFGYEHTIQDLSDHPAITGEWTGKRLPDSYCRAVGLAPGCVSTAAGAYQFIKPTWENLKRYLDLPDFTAASQDEAATQLLRDSGSIDDILYGNFEEAIRKNNRIWASLPGSPYGQPTRTMNDLKTKYLEYGGKLIVA